MRVYVALVVCFCLGAVACAPVSSEGRSAGRGTAMRQAQSYEWPAAANGLEARIEEGVGGRWEDQSIFVAFRNAGERPITFPGLRVLNQAGDSPWRVEVRRAGKWQVVPWEQVRVLEAAPGSDVESREVSESGPAVTLKRGETALVHLVLGSAFGFFRDAQETRVVLAQETGGRIEGWSGRLEIATTAGRESRNRDLPHYIPRLSRARLFGVGEPMFASEFQVLRGSNQHYLKRLANYRPEQVAQALDRQLSAERDVQARILLAVEAARRGSVAGRDFLLECRKNTDYAIAYSTCAALWHASTFEPAPEWVMQAMVDALVDERQTTNRPSELENRDSLPISQVAQGAHLLAAFGRLKYPPAVPLFLKWAQEEDVRALDAILALGAAGDPRAIPVLLELLKEQENDPGFACDRLDKYRFILSSLLKLKAPGARELLFARIYDHWTVEMVEFLGDARALPALRKIVAAGRPALIKGSTPERNRSCVDASRVAIATLEPGAPIPRYCALLNDPALAGTHFTAAVRIRDARQVNPVAVPTLLGVIRTSPDGSIASVAIQALARYRYKSVVAGLIDCFDVDFAKKKLEKTSPDAFADEIGASLAEITGKRFGADAAAWKAWWAAEGRGLTELK